MTVKTIKKKQKHKSRGSVRTVTKSVQADSFFNFFSPPAMPEDPNSTLASDIQVRLKNHLHIHGGCARVFINPPNQTSICTQRFGTKMPLVHTCARSDTFLDHYQSYLQGAKLLCGCRTVDRYKLVRNRHSYLVGLMLYIYYFFVFSRRC